MLTVVGIRFKSCGKIYDFEVNGLEVGKGDRVIVDSEFGLGIGSVVLGPVQVENPGKELKKVIRIASDDDLRQKDDNEVFEKETRNFCLERIMARGLPMKLICTEVTLDKKRIIFYFTADGRIDFRELVKDLAAKFKTRIEMRQIGVRDKAKMVGGLGLCGKELCCRLFLTTFEPISIKMAKQQELTLNTGKLSGICGRLMCCLGYEYNECQRGEAPCRGAVPLPADEAVPDVSPEEATVVHERAGVASDAVAVASSPPSAEPGKQVDKQRPEGFKRRKKRRRYRRKPRKNE
jgi:cell fate regulator YaaT (PSP1 superfamily)